MSENLARDLLLHGVRLHRGALQIAQETGLQYGYTKKLPAHSEFLDDEVTTWTLTENPLAHLTSEVSMPTSERWARIGHTVASKAMHRPNLFGVELHITAEGFNGERDAVAVDHSYNRGYGSPYEILWKSFGKTAGLEQFADRFFDLSLADIKLPLWRSNEAQHADFNRLQQGFESLQAAHPSLENGKKPWLFLFRLADNHYAEILMYDHANVSPEDDAADRTFDKEIQLSIYSGALTRGVPVATIRGCSARMRDGTEENAPLIIANKLLHYSETVPPPLTTCDLNDAEREHMLRIFEQLCGQPQRATRLDLFSNFIENYEDELEMLEPITIDLSALYLSWTKS